MCREKQCLENSSCVLRISYYTFGHDKNVWDLPYSSICVDFSLEILFILIFYKLSNKCIICRLKQ